jgi:Mycobacteriophage tail assembly protein
MSTFTLDDIRAAADARYGSLDIPLSDGLTARLLNPLRLPKEKRDELSAMQDKMEEKGSDQEQILADVVRLVAENDAQAEALLSQVGGDLAMLAVIFERYSEGVQVGEAEASQS